ncbi:MAG: isoleucine--tRNA ligase [Oscillospiraceae bacterium]|jgi:isoleucyl-tRNA synthetase|nr:isoleucine--tRNA ligase [Oscillospiraceae bacterium]
MAQNHSKDYNNTLNLPQTEFPMRANLPEREPLMLKKWEDGRLYYKLAEKNKEKPKYILHDGPPYANGDIHMGHALNKILKDIIVKYKAMTGFSTPFVPGWDCHGLPIELRALKELGIAHKKVETAELRKYCRDYALSFLDRQKAQMKRIGAWGDFDNPYLTIAPDYEAKQIEVFGDMYKKGYIYKGLKPVHWCADCKTALAEAEIEYEEDECYSIYVKFPVTDDKGKFKGIDLSRAYVLIWTTTTWTLPGNLAISLGPDYNYTFIKAEDEDNPSFGDYILVAKELAEQVAKECKLEKYSLVGEYKGSELDLLETAHPFLPRKSIIITGGHVTLESGTGCVHTAPGFGVEDYEVCNSYKGLFDIIVPVDENGKMTAEAGANIAEKSTGEANKIIASDLKEKNLLLATTKFSHSYPHCWRCREPIIYRATDQWFCAVSMFRDETIKAINEVQWIPKWGQERILNMVRDRSDWCISRQKRWGVPIPILYCGDCGKEICNDLTIKAISELFRKSNSDAWYALEPSEFIPADVKCSCGCGNFKREMDILDVWFDSGCSHAAVCEQRPELESPCDLYLEGSDQFRGWFQSSLLTSVAVNNRAPYKAVSTHGWVLDGEGKEMHKSKGNVIPPEHVVDKYGADVLRLWVSSLDFHSDVKISDDLLKQISETYRKIRNTARFILGNLGGFAPEKDMLDVNELMELDKWALLCFDALSEKVMKSYEEFDYYYAYHAINNFCVVDMSNFYLDIIKDRLYCEKANGFGRKSAQTAMFTILHGLTRLIAPILCFTADEIWAELPKFAGDDKHSVIFNDMPVKTGVSVSAEFIAKWDKIKQIRGEVLTVLEQKRAEKTIGKSLEAKVILKSAGDLSAILPELASAFIVSQVVYEKGGEALEITVEKADGNKCARCWIYSESVSEDELCGRCLQVIKT